jgi:uncharacterized caspase-like protein
MRAASADTTLHVRIEATELDKKLLLEKLNGNGKSHHLKFAAADTDKGLLAATAVESSWLVERLEECRARQQILILDCCFSGAFAKDAKGPWT